MVINTKQKGRDKNETDNNNPVGGVLFTCVTAFTCGRCDPPNCIETTECDSTGYNCHTVRKHRHFTSFSLGYSASQLSDNNGILDLSNVWQLDSNSPPTMT